MIDPDDWALAALGMIIILVFYTAAKYVVDSMHLVYL